MKTLLKGIATVMVMVLLGFVPASDIPKDRSQSTKENETPYSVYVIDGDIHEGVYADLFVEEFDE